MSRLRVLVVNDSPTMRASLRAALERSPDVDVVGELADGAGAADEVARLRPSVVLMDVVMPACNGYEATRAIMSRCPTPVVMITAAVNPRDERVIFEALGAGALGITHAPPPPTHPEHRVAAAGLVQLLRTMAGAKVEGATVAAVERTPTPTEDADGPVHAIGLVASAGGPPALVAILRELRGRRMPPMLVVQHMVSGFAAGFASWLSAETGYPVSLASPGEALRGGWAYVAPDGRQLGVARNRTVVVNDDPPVNRFRPSGDYLIRSMARSLGSAAAAVVLTGMGRDGAAGALELRRAGGFVIAQDAATSVIDGMPRAVRESGAASRVVSLSHIPAALQEIARGQR